MKKTTEIVSPTARLFGDLLDNNKAGLTQNDLKLQMGFTEASNIITQIRKGRTRLPIGRIGEICHLLKEDPRPLFAVAMEEYYPDIMQAYQAVSGEVVNDDERRVLEIYRGVKTQMLENNKDDAVNAYVQECLAKGEIPREHIVKKLKRRAMMLTEDTTKIKKLKSVLKESLDLA